MDISGLDYQTAVDTSGFSIYIPKLKQQTNKDFISVQRGDTIENINKENNNNAIHIGHTGVKCYIKSFRGH